MTNVTKEHCLEIINQFEPCLENKKQEALGIDGKLVLAATEKGHQKLNPRKPFLWVEYSVSHYSRDASYAVLLLLSAKLGFSKEGERDTHRESWKG